MGEGGVEAERDHDRRAVGYADRRRERSERLSQPLLCPFSLIRRQRPLGSVRRGKVARYKGKQAIPPLVVPPCAEAVPPQSGGTTGACFTCCNGVWVIPRNEPARHRGTTLRLSRVTGVTNRASAGLAPLCIIPSRGRAASQVRRPERGVASDRLHCCTGVEATPLRLSLGLAQHHRPRARRSVGMWHTQPCTACRRSLHRDTFATLIRLCLGLLPWVPRPIRAGYSGPGIMRAAVAAPETVLESSSVSAGSKRRRRRSCCRPRRVATRHTITCVSTRKAGLSSRL